MSESLSPPPECPCQSYKGFEKLEPGMIVDVYVQQDNGIHKYEGKATLIRRPRTFFAPVPFPIIEHCPLCRLTTNNIKEMWVVEPERKSSFDKEGLTHIRHIHKFHSYGTPHVRDEIDLEGKDLEEEEDRWYGDE